MPFFGLFKKTQIKKLHPFDVSFQYHKESTGNLVVYNLGYRRVFDIEIIIVNQNMDNYSYHYDEILQKIAVVIAYTSQPDASGRLFTGDVAKVVIYHQKQEHIFIKEGEGFLRK